MPSSNPENQTPPGSLSHFTSNPEAPQVQAIQQKLPQLSAELASSRDNLQYKLVIMGRRVIELEDIVKGLVGSMFSSRVFS